MKQHMRIAGFLQEAGTGFFSSIGLLGIFLAAVGLYGVVSWSVYRRQQEIGIRMAMGAQASDVLALVFKQGFGLVAVGMTIGLGTALAIAPIAAHALYGISAFDPLSYLAGALLVIAIAFAAMQVPARRAVRLDPIAVLRRE